MTKMQSNSSKTNTTNESFIKLSQKMKEKGYGNWEEPLTLIHEELRDIEIHELLSRKYFHLFPSYSFDWITKMQKLAIDECKQNPWYFFREIARVPMDTGVVGGHCRKYEITEADAAIIQCYIDNRKSINYRCRNTGLLTTISLIAVYDFLFNDKMASYFSSYHRLSEATYISMGKINSLLSLLPTFFLNGITIDKRIIIGETPSYPENNIRRELCLKITNNNTGSVFEPLTHKNVPRFIDLIQNDNSTVKLFGEGFYPAYFEKSMKDGTYIEIMNNLKYLDYMCIGETGIEHTNYKKWLQYYYPCQIYRREVSYLSSKYKSSKDNIHIVTIYNCDDIPEICTDEWIKKQRICLCNDEKVISRELYLGYPPK